MLNLAKLEFISLDITRKNYISWVIDIKMYLESMRLTRTIKERNSISPQDKIKAIIFIRRYLNEGLKCEYLVVKNPSVLLKSLKEEFDHQKNVVFSVIRDE